VVKVIVGLGNPGLRYAATRHNVGFRAVDELASRWDIDVSRERFHGWFGSGPVGDETVALVKPTTFMNRSGQAVLAVGRFYRIDMEDLLIVVDDFALPLGRIRLRSRGSSGGHNGLSDIIGRLGSEAFARLRIGVGEAIGDPARFVLERFSEQEESIVRRVVQRGADAVACWLESGTEAAMNRFNGMPDVAD
jgi:PTH1 family peptidyl-tRNA hydrolase